MTTTLPTNDAHTVANVDLAFRLLDEVLADPDSAERIPIGARVVPLPYDEPNLRLRNLALAGRRASAGESVYLRRIGGPRGEDGRCFSGRDGDPHLAIRYDPTQAALVIDLSAGDRPTMRLFISREIAVLVDEETLAVVGYSVPEAMVARIVESPSAKGRGRADRDYAVGLGGPQAPALFAEDLAPVAA